MIRRLQLLIRNDNLSIREKIFVLWMTEVGRCIFCVTQLTRPFCTVEPVEPIGPLENPVGDIVFILDSAAISNQGSFIMWKSFVVQLMSRYGISTSGSRAGTNCFASSFIVVLSCTYLDHYTLFFIGNTVA